MVLSRAAAVRYGIGSRSRIMACVEEKNLPTLVDGVQVYNDGNPIPPGTQASITCCLCCHSPGIAYSGIPEGTTRVPEAEEKEILQRWYGHWKLYQSLGSANPFSGARLAFTDGDIDGNILALSGNILGAQAHLQGYRIDALRLDEVCEERGHDKATMAAYYRQTQKQRLSLWRGTDGTLYIDNTGTRLVSETPTELMIKNSIGFDMKFLRFDMERHAFVREGAGASPAGVVVQGMAAPIAPVMERGDPAERLIEAKKLLDQGLISQSDFDAKKKEIMAVL